MKLHLHKGQDFSVILARNKNRKSGPYESARSYLYLSAQNLEPSIVLKARGRNPSGPKNIVKPLIPVFELHDYMVSIRQREKNLKQLEHYNHALWHPGASQQLSNDSLLEWIKWCLQSWNTETHKKMKLFKGIWSWLLYTIHKCSHCCVQFFNAAAGHIAYEPLFMCPPVSGSYHLSSSLNPLQPTQVTTGFLCNLWALLASAKCARLSGLLHISCSCTGCFIHEIAAPR